MGKKDKITKDIVLSRLDKLSKDAGRDADRVQATKLLAEYLHLVKTSAMQPLFSDDGECVKYLIESLATYYGIDSYRLFDAIDKLLPERVEIGRRDWKGRRMVKEMAEDVRSAEEGAKESREKQKEREAQRERFKYLEREKKRRRYREDPDFREKCKREAHKKKER